MQFVQFLWQQQQKKREKNGQGCCSDDIKMKGLRRLW